mgnify:CR=1 FL=1
MHNNEEMNNDGSSVWINVNKLSMLLTEGWCRGRCLDDGNGSFQSQSDKASSNKQSSRHVWQCGGG